MARTTFAWAVVALVALTTGCAVAGPTAHGLPPAPAEAAAFFRGRSPLACRARPHPPEWPAHPRRDSLHKLEAFGPAVQLFPQQWITNTFGCEADFALLLYPSKEPRACTS